jgi:hypothetical protein
VTIVSQELTDLLDLARPLSDDIHEQLQRCMWQLDQHAARLPG